jgi:hypothetical protein
MFYTYSLNIFLGCHKFKAFVYNLTDGELYFGMKYKDGLYPENYVRCVRVGVSSITPLTSYYEFKEEFKEIQDEVITLIE